MAVWAEVRTAHLEDTLRFDAEYYRPAYLKFVRKLKRIPSRPLGLLAFITDGQHGYFTLDERSDIRQITAKHIIGGLVERDLADHLSAETHNKNLRSSLQVGDVLVTTAGTIGVVGYVTQDVPPANIDQDVARIYVWDSRLHPLFLWVFLQTRLGQFQIDRFSTGQVQRHLSLSKARNLLVPIPSWQEEIVAIAQSYIDVVNRGRNFYTSAERILEKELGFDNINLYHRADYESRLHEVLMARRWDASCFNPMFLRYGEIVRKYGNFDRLGQVIFPPVKGIQQDNVDKGDIAYGSIKHVRDFEMVTDASASGSIVASKVAEPGDLLLAITGATIGKVGILARYKRLAYSGDLLRLRVKGGLDPHYLLVVLRSPIGQGQLLRWVTGSTNGHLAPRDVTRVIVPRLGKKEQAIADKVRQALSTRKEAEDLLKQAKRRVEDLIEE